MATVESATIREKRVAKQQVVIPQGVEATLKDKQLTIKGKNGSLFLEIHRLAEIKKEDGTYALKLSEYYSMGVTLRYIRSDFALKSSNDLLNTVNTFAVDISMQPPASVTVTS